MTPSTEDSELTLQVNVCAGDLEYCGLTVPALVRTHRRDVKEVVVVADCCRPQGTPYVHRASRFPELEFDAKVARLHALAERWVSQGTIDRVEYLQPDPAALRALNKKYSGRATSWSHDHLGHAYSAYFAAWESAKTRYVLHFDADILLYQSGDYSWVRTAISRLRADPALLAASPRIAPVLEEPGQMVRTGAPGCGWLPTWRLDSTPIGWRSDWTSTRCHLLDLERLARLLPLRPRRGEAADAFNHGLNALVSPAFSSSFWTAPVPASGFWRLPRRIARRVAREFPSFPLPPEVLLHEHASGRGAASIYLNDPRAWYVHPDTKPPDFIALLPKMLEAVSEGRCPEAQRGLSGIQFEAWHEFDPTPAGMVAGSAEK